AGPAAGGANAVPRRGRRPLLDGGVPRPRRRPGMGQGRSAGMRTIGALALLPILAGGLRAFQALRQTAEAPQRETRGPALLTSIRDPSSALYRPEAAHRDYLLAADDEYRDAYRAAVEATRQAIAHLQTAAVGDQRRQRVEDLAARIASRIASMDGAIATHDG